MQGLLSLRERFETRPLFLDVCFDVEVPGCKQVSILVCDVGKGTKGVRPSGLVPHAKECDPYAFGHFLFPKLGCLERKRRDVFEVGVTNPCRKHAQGVVSRVVQSFEVVHEKFIHLRIVFLLHPTLLVRPHPTAWPVLGDSIELGFDLLDGHLPDRFLAERSVVSVGLCGVLWLGFHFGIRRWRSWWRSWWRHRLELGQILVVLVLVRLFVFYLRL